MDFLKLHTFVVVNAFSVLTVVGQLIALIVLMILLKEFFAKSETKLGKWIVKHGMPLMLLGAFLATVGSLFFSDIAGWTPCKDCWLQRIVMYPQVLILAIALWKQDRNAAWYIIALSIIGIVLSAHHYGEQLEAAMTPVPDANGVNVLLKPCDGSGVSCAATQIHFTFGYITLPMMALTVFLLNALTSAMMIVAQKRESLLDRIRNKLQR